MMNIGRRGEAWEGGECGWGKSLGMGRGGLNAGVGRGRARKVGVHGSLGCSQRWGRREEGAVGVGMGWIMSRVVGNGDWMSREGVWWARERIKVMDFYMGAYNLKRVIDSKVSFQVLAFGHPKYKVPRPSSRSAA